MALGPKAMGEAIIANLKVKTGKDLAGWQDELRRAGVDGIGEARDRLREWGLGQFQSVTVAEVTFGDNHYVDERKLVDDQFARFPEQRALYDGAVAQLAEYDLAEQPCRTYLPLYRDRKIAVSFKPTRNGLYAALNLQNPDQWPNRVAHKPSLGGSARLQHGVYLTDESDVRRLVAEVR